MYELPPPPTSGDTQAGVYRLIKPEVTVTLVNRIGETEQTHTPSVPILDASNKNGPRTAKEAGELAWELTFTAAEANRLRVKSGEKP